jgi:hypothetical protein
MKVVRETKCIDMYISQILVCLKSQIAVTSNDDKVMKIRFFIFINNTVSMGPVGMFN